MIPKKIHYCRFGYGDKSELILKCIKSWHQFCPDYEIIEWNESNCDINKNDWVIGAYKNKKYAFVADYFRLEKLYEHGGIYLDTDTELKKSLNSVLDNTGFLSFDSRKILGFGVIGSVKNNFHLKNLISIYSNLNFKIIPINDFGTNYFKDRGIILNGCEQIIDNIKIYQSNIFSIDLGDDSCISIDHHNNSWVDGKTNPENHKNRVYVEYLATQDKRINDYLDYLEIYYTSSMTRKIGCIIVNIILFLKIDKIIKVIKK